MLRSANMIREDTFNRTPIIFKNDAIVSTSHQWEYLLWFGGFLINSWELVFILMILELWFPFAGAIYYWRRLVLLCFIIANTPCRSLSPAEEAQIQIGVVSCGFCWQVKLVYVVDISFSLFRHVHSDPQKLMYESLSEKHLPASDGCKGNLLLQK